MKDPRYIGDGVYVGKRIDGAIIIAVNDHRNEVVVLEDNVANELVKYITE